MLARLKTWAAGISTSSRGGEDIAPPGASELATATALLLVEAASLDDDFDQDEERAILGILTGRLDVSAEDAITVVAEARTKHEGHVALQGLTKTIKENLEPEDRITIMEMLWEVAYSDGNLDDFEANLARRVAGLLHIPDRDSGAARKRVVARLEQKSNPA